MPLSNRPIEQVLSRQFLDLSHTHDICVRQTYDIGTREPILDLVNYVNKDGLQLLHDNNSHLSQEHQEKLVFVLMVLNPNNHFKIGEDYHIQTLMGHDKYNNTDSDEQ